MTTRKPLPGELLITQEQLNDSVTVVALAGELDMATAPSLTETLESVNHGTSSILLEISELSFIDSHGLHALLQAATPRSAAPGAGTDPPRLIVVSPSAHISRVLDLTRANLVLHIAARLNDALALIEQQPATVQTNLRPELDRLSASFRKTPTTDYISISDDTESVRLVGPAREQPRRTWNGPRWQSLELLHSLPDNAGAAAVWQAGLRQNEDARLPRLESPAPGTARPSHQRFRTRRR